MSVKPFIKWVGGKTQLLKEIRKKYPAGNIKKYCEPFLGGGAVFFDANNNYDFKNILLNDLNKDLITTYKVIQKDINLLIKNLKDIQDTFMDLSLEKRSEFYYEKRTTFNTISRNNTLEVATLFIFLNKTCFNGLYRVNSKGGFNVPMGNYKKPLICDETNLIKVNQALKNVNLTTSSYENCLDFIDGNTLVYLDPPYLPISKSSSFTSYTKEGFGVEDQIKLSEFIKKISDVGAKIILSNSDPKNLDDNDIFFDKLYKDYNLERILANRAINCKNDGRGKISEILVSNFN